MLGFSDFIKKIFTPVKQGNLINFYLKDEKCGEKIKLLVRKSYDIQRIYEDSEEADYRLNKVVICNSCYNKINVKIDFDKRYNIIDSQIDGGKIIAVDEYNKNQDM
jgi:hypothetical protein